MLKIHGLDIKGQVILIPDLPPLRQLMVRPMTAAGIGAQIAGIVFAPARVLLGGIPDHLGIGTDQQVFPPPLQPLSVRGIQHLVIFPFIG